MSWLNATIDASGLFSSCATPATSRPIASIFCAWTSSAWRRLRSVRSRTIDNERGSPPIAAIGGKMLSDAPTAAPLYFILTAPISAL